MTSTARDALRAKQKPLKTAYTENPGSAVITLKSTGSLDGTSITCKLDTGKAVKEAQRVAGLHPKAGGEDAAISGELCSGDMLLDALVACAGVTLKAVATNLSLPLTGGEITAEGDLDFKGTMGVDKSAKVGITDIRLRYNLKFGTKDNGKTITQDELDLLGKMTEKYCVVLQTLGNKPTLSSNMVAEVPEDDPQIKTRTLLWNQTFED